MTKMTRQKAIARVAWTSWSEFTIDCERSKVGMSWIEPGNSRCSSGNNRADRARDLDCIRAGLPRDGENNYRGGRMKIAGKEMPREAFVFDPVDDPGDIAEVDRRIVRPAGDDQVAIAFSVFELALRPERDRLVLAIELAGAGIGGAGADRRRQIIEGHVARGERAGIDFDPDRAL